MSATGRGKHRAPSPQPRSRAGSRPGASEPFLIVDRSRASSVEKPSRLRDSQDYRETLASGGVNPAVVASTQAMGSMKASAPQSTLDLAEPSVEIAKNAPTEALGLVSGAQALLVPDDALHSKSRPANGAARRTRSDANSDSLLGRSTDLVMMHSMGEKVMAARLLEPTLSPRNNLEVYRDEELSQGEGRYGRNKNESAPPNKRSLDKEPEANHSMKMRSTSEVQEEDRALKTLPMPASQLADDA